MLQGRLVCRQLHTSRVRPSVIDKLFKKAPARWSKAKENPLSVEAAESAQKLRAALQDPSANEIAPSLMDLVAKCPEKLPPQFIRLVGQSLDKSPENLPLDHLQEVFRLVAKSSEANVTEGNLTARLYLQLYRQSRLSPEDRLINGLLFFKSLRQRGMFVEASQMVQALLKTNEPAVNDKFIIELFRALRETQPDAASIIAIVQACKTPSNETVWQALEVLGDRRSELQDEEQRTKAIEAIVAYSLFDRPHVSLEPQTLILLLDTLLEADAPETGRRVLNYSLQRGQLPQTVENLELMLLACIRFEEKTQVGDQLVRQIMDLSAEQPGSLVKETWDILAQWTVYRSNDLQLLKDVIEEMKEAGFTPDNSTMHSVVQVASNSAKRSETDISDIVSYFYSLGVESDAICYSVLMERALASVELERARQLFIESTDSGADWNIEDNKYTDTLNKLIVALATAPTIDSAVVFDTYQRVRGYTPVVSRAAQAELLKMFFFHESNYDIGMFLIEQFGETPNLPYEQYPEIYNAFYDKIMACGDYKQAWDLYGMLNCTISLPYESYYPVQLKFCQLGRPDAAHLMFRHLRNRAKKEGIQPPGREMYLMLFAEYGRWLYEEGIRELEIYFRMDLNNELDIGVMNGMLLAYSNLQESRKVRDLWFETVSFPPGVGANHESLTIMLRYLTRVDLDAVDDLWQEMPTRFGLKPDESTLKQYLIANCYHGYYSRALDILKAAPELYGVEVSANLIENVYNWTLVDNRKEQVKEWALEAHPEMWQQLISTNKLKQLVLPENTENDSEVSLRAQTIEQLEAPNKLVKATHRTDDID